MIATTIISSMSVKPDCFLFTLIACDSEVSNGHWSHYSRKLMFRPGFERQRIVRRTGVSILLPIHEKKCEVHPKMCRLAASKEGSQHKSGHRT